MRELSLFISLFAVMWGMMFICNREHYTLAVIVTAIIISLVFYFTAYKVSTWWDKWSIWHLLGSCVFTIFVFLLVDRLGKDIALIIATYTSIGAGVCYEYLQLEYMPSKSDVYIQVETSPRGKWFKRISDHFIDFFTANKTGCAGDGVYNTTGIIIAIVLIYIFA